MGLRVHFYQIRFSDYIDYFRTLLDSDIIIAEGREIPEPANYDILIHPTPSKEWLQASPNLKAVVIPWAGIPEKTRQVLKESPEISLHNLHHNRFNTAELGFALMLAAAKFIVPMDQALRKNDWSPRYEETKAILLKGRTVLILGFGEIGQAFSKYCLGLGMQVKAIKKHTKNTSQNKDVAIYPSDDLHSLLPKANILFIALPLTDETEDLIGENEIRLLPKGSILVNVGRGPIVNQYALFNALKEGHLRAAASDVWYHYPDSKVARENTPPSDVPFGALDNFVLSPHRGGMVEEVEKQRAKALANLLNAANSGQEIPNKVDIYAGY